MAIKIVSDKPVEPKRVICPKCRYELAFTGEDIVMRGAEGDTPCIVCPRPSCRHTIAVQWP